MADTEMDEARGLRSRAGSTPARGPFVHRATPPPTKRGFHLGEHKFQAVTLGAKNVDQCSRKVDPEIKYTANNHLILTNVSKAYIGEKTTSSISGTGKSIF